MDGVRAEQERERVAREYISAGTTSRTRLADRVLPCAQAVEFTRRYKDEGILSVVRSYLVRSGVLRMLMSLVVDRASTQETLKATSSGT